MRKKKIYIICPVTKGTPPIIQEYVFLMERLHNYVCHFPPRDVNQNASEFEICTAHRKAMKQCDEIHIFWDETSLGSHFDLGMAFALKKKIALIKLLSKTFDKSFYKFILEYQSENKN